MAKKLQSSLAVEGELPDDWPLTRKIFADEAGEESVEDVFARAQQVVAEAEELLVDAEWSAPQAGGRRGHRPMATAVATRLRSPAVALLRGHSDPECE